MATKFVSTFENEIAIHTCDKNHIRVYVIPKNKVNNKILIEENKELTTETESIYFLCGWIDGKPSVYVGQGNAYSRINAHNKSEDPNRNFYTYVIVVTRSGGLNPTQKDCLESYWVNELRNNTKYSIKNTQTPKEALNPNAVDKEIIVEINSTVKEILYQHLNRLIFTEQIQSNNTLLKVDDEIQETPNDYFICRGKNSEAKGVPVEDGKFKVLCGSTFRKYLTPELEKNGRKQKRDELIQCGILKDNGEHNYILIESYYIFNSSSEAASLSLGGQYSGPEVWKRKSDGKSLKDLEL